MCLEIPGWKLVAICVGFLLSGQLLGQQPDAPETFATSHLSATIYFPSAVAEASSRADLHRQVAPMVDRLNGATLDSLPGMLGHAEGLIAALQTHAAFWKVQALEDTHDQNAKQARDQVESDESMIEAAMNARLRRVPSGLVLSLGTYAFLARMAQQDATHGLSPDAQRYRGAVVLPAEQNIADAYDLLDARLGSPKGISSPDAMVRRDAIKERNAAYASLAPEEATLLAELVGLENRDAVAQGYRNAADRKYQQLGLDESTVSSTLAAVAAEAPVYRSYQKVLADHAASTLHVVAALSSEIDMASSKAPAIPLDEARRMILSALQPLGDDYVKRFAQLLDPANGRLDLAGGAHRANAGTSISAYDAPTALYYSGYNGSLRDVSKIAHEGGHAIHRELMNAAEIPIYERSGPNYVFEGFAIFNELLLLDHAAETAETPLAKQCALERLLSKISLELFVSAEETSFERSIYTEAVEQPLLDRAKIDSAFRASLQPYEYFPVDDVGQSRGWMRKSLLFEDPLYLVNYLYASVIAVALYDKSQSDPDFAAKYEALLRRGFDAEPRALLASLGIQLGDPNVIKPVARLLEKKTAELEHLYAQKLD
jgi:oligoendopeptidase F